MDRNMGAKCFRCGHTLIPNNSFTRDEVYGDGEEDATVETLTCPHCGLEYELCEPIQEERKDFPYYQEISNSTK